MTNKKYIVIEGNIGAGKTSLVKKMADQYNASPIFEQFKDNPFLPKFYKNPEKYAFQLEVSFLMERYQQLNKELLNYRLYHEFTIADYYFTKSLVFARETLKNEEFKLYRQIFSLVYKEIIKPDLYVFLYSSSDRLLKNIQKRNRSYEQNIAPEYLTKISNSYMDYLKQVTEFPVLILDIEQIDFIGNENDFKKLSDTIMLNEYKKGANQLIM